MLIVKRIACTVFEAALLVGTVATILGLNRLAEVLLSNPQ